MGPAALGQHVHEGLSVVGLAQGRSQLGLRRAGAPGAGGQDAARHRDQRRDVRQGGRRAGEPRQRLPDLGDVPVAGDLVGADVPHDLAAEQGRARSAPGPARPARGGDDEILRGDQPGSQQGAERQRHGGRVAARAGDPTGAQQVLPEELGQAVRPLPRVRRVVVALPVLSAGQPVVRAEVDDRQVRRQLGGERRGLPVRQGEEHDVGLGQHLDGRRLEGPVGQLRQVRVQISDRLARRAARSDGTQSEVGVGQQKAQQLAARVAAGASDRCHHPHLVIIHTPAWLCRQHACPGMFKVGRCPSRFG